MFESRGTALFLLTEDLIDFNDNILGPTFQLSVCIYF